jgi:hypothetical protein
VIDRENADNLQVQGDQAVATFDDFAAPSEPQASAAQVDAPVWFRAEVLIYAAVVLLSVIIRVWGLNDVPLSANEAREALSAWRIVAPFDTPATTETPLVAESVFVWSAQKIMFSMFGAHEWSARFLTAVLGGVLVLAPLLFIPTIGRIQAFWWVLLLACAPSFIAAARESSGIIWALALMVLLLWCVQGYWQQPRGWVGVLGVAAFMWLIVADASGVLLVLLLALTALGVWLWANTGERDQFADAEPAPAPWYTRFEDVPYTSGLIVGGLVIFVVSTNFMSYPAGLTALGEALRLGLAGFFVPQPNTPAVQVLGISLFYELGFWVLAGVAVVVLLFREQRWIDQALVVCLAAGSLLALIYGGGVPAYAVWLTIPLTGLISAMLVSVFTDDPRADLWLDIADEQQRANVLQIGRWLTMLGVIALLFVIALHLRVVSSVFLEMTVSRDSVVQPLVEMWQRVMQQPNNAYARERVSIVWLPLSVSLLAVGYLLAASTWGNRTAWQGALLGACVFVGVVGVGTGWGIAVKNSTLPIEPWRTSPTTIDVFLLRDTLSEVDGRQSTENRAVSISVFAPSDGLVAWAVRDYPNAQFVNDISLVDGQAVVLVCVDEQPNSECPSASDTAYLTRNAYFGQSFALTNFWNRTDVVTGLWDWLPHWVQRATRAPNQLIISDQQVIFWLREDAYVGIPEDEFLQP